MSKTNIASMIHWMLVACLISFIGTGSFMVSASSHTHSNLCLPTLHGGAIPSSLFETGNTTDSPTQNESEAAVSVSTQGTADTKTLGASVASPLATSNSIITEVTDQVGHSLEQSEPIPEQLRGLKEQEIKHGPLKVLFLSADTGGGHRASAESLAKQFLLHFPGSTYDLVDVWTLDGVYPYNTLVNSYQHLSAHPRQWKYLYHISNSRPYEFIMDIHSTLFCERRIRKRIESYEPDVVVSVHPTMNNVPLISTRKISKKLGKHIPFFTVVTDLGSGHCTWFQKSVDKIYIASERIRKLAKRRGRAPDENMVMTGLPIRHDFAVQSEQMGDRTSAAGKDYQRQIRSKLGVNPDKHMVLVMGGGEGVGSLSDIVNNLYKEFTKEGIDANIYVVCGRNEKLKNDLETRDCESIVNGNGDKKFRSKRKRLARLIKRTHRSKKMQESLDNAAKRVPIPHPQGDVDVVGLGFETKMAEYMVAADVLVTKAGPGTIAEAAAVGLPVMLTSFLPGQEAGNVEVVLDAGFGDYNDNPEGIAAEVACWLQDQNLLIEMSHATDAASHPYAAQEIVLDIGRTTLSWMALNGSRDR